MKCLQSLLTCLRFNMLNIGGSSNYSLPTWMEVEVTSDMLRIYGTPAVLDKGIILIQVLDIYDFVVKEFEIEVSDQKTESKIYIKKIDD